MSWIWLVEIVTVMLLTYLVLLILIASRVAHVHDYPSSQIVVDPTRIKTGDILGVSYSHSFGYLISSWSKSIWSHAGLAWRDPTDNSLYVLEAAHYGGEYQGIFRIPFEKWLRINRKSRLAWTSLATPATPELTRALQLAHANLKSRHLDGFNLDWYRFVQDRPYGRNEATHLVCSEVVVEMLQAAGVIRKEKASSNYSSGDLVWGRFPLEPSYTYAPPMEMVPLAIPT